MVVLSLLGCGWVEQVQKSTVLCTLVLPSQLETFLTIPVSSISRRNWPCACAIHYISGFGLKMLSQITITLNIRHLVQIFDIRSRYPTVQAALLHAEGKMV